MKIFDYVAAGRVVEAQRQVRRMSDQELEKEYIVTTTAYRIITQAVRRREAMKRDLLEEKKC